MQSFGWEIRRLRLEGTLRIPLNLFEYWAMKSGSLQLKDHLQELDSMTLNCDQVAKNYDRFNFQYSRKDHYWFYYVA